METKGFQAFLYCHRGRAARKSATAYYNYDLFVNVMKRNPTNVELLQIGNGNSEHCRHWYFKGQIVIDGQIMARTPMELVQEPLKRLGPNNRTRKAFNDDAGVLGGFAISILLPEMPGKPSKLSVMRKVVHITCTAETHNHPTFVAPFPGAQTGAGGRIRDNSAVGRGGIVGIGVAGYFIGNVFIPDYEIPGEFVGRNRLSKYASPLSILIEGSNGVSSYGNQFGEPLTLGFCRSFEQMVDGEHRAARKPILYSGGLGHLFDEHVKKEDPEIGMLIVRIGPPAYPIGVGGGSASSMMQGQNTETLDFNSVQRGNAMEENCDNRVIRGCVEKGKNNPIATMHDQGAGGISNAFTELMELLGGIINIRNVKLGDKTMSDEKIWTAEFQESYAFLIWESRLGEFKEICIRERVNCEILGKIDGSGKVVVMDPATEQRLVDLRLDHILSKMPQKRFETTRKVRNLEPLELPDMTVGEAIEKVFKQLSVGSKGFLIHKVDRDVTGLVAQQQSCGIAQIATADNSVNAQSHFGLTGAAAALGEQPIKMLIDSKAGARMAVAEMITNMASVRISDIEDIRCRANWMGSPKLPHEGASFYDAVVAMSDFMISLGIAADGGKDSLSMAATVQGELVKAPTSLVILGYAPVPDITKKVTPDIKKPGKSLLGLIDLGRVRGESGRWYSKNRLGGSALAQACNMLGNESPDIEDPALLKKAFLAVQKMIDEGLVLAVHDRSDGGLITAVAEMCMASRCGFHIEIGGPDSAIPELFSEELGLVLEFRQDDLIKVMALCESFGVPFDQFGCTVENGNCLIYRNGGWDDDIDFWSGNIIQLRQWWESTSHEIEKLQMNPVCAKEEYQQHRYRLPSILEAPSYRLSFTPTDTIADILNASGKPRVAIIRTKGTNGDREMQAACAAAGLEPWDVAMSDLLDGKISLKMFKGIIFAGGFSYMDVFDSAKGWAGSILFNDRLKAEFDEFYAREDTFSLGVCNGCQLMALLGWIPWRGIESVKQPRFIHNLSGRFESRWVQAEILPSPSVLLKGMEGSKLGVWVAHGEGRLVYPDPSIREEVMSRKLAPLAYLDPFGNRTEEYPYNPNGSPNGITSLCSIDGRHLAMMPHPERCFRLWQWPWMPDSWRGLEASPWLRMFQNARTFCTKQ